MKSGIESWNDNKSTDFYVGRRHKAWLHNKKRLAKVDWGMELKFKRALYVQCLIENELRTLNLRPILIVFRPVQLVYDRLERISSHERDKRERSNQFKSKAVFEHN